MRKGRGREKALWNEMDNNCMYCDKGKQLQRVMLPVCEIGGFPLYLMKNQTYRGRVVLACDEHIGTIAGMEDEKSVNFFRAVQKTASILTEVFHPGQVNIGMYADKMNHLHCHITPKYPGGPDWGGTFQMDPQPPVLLSYEEYEVMIQKIKNEAAKQEKAGKIRGDSGCL
ncbi:MAG: HIT family protein [Clostridiaceae bacterium]|nr:HIT family protein [Clostridiaceae bacterium]